MHSTDASIPDNILTAIFAGKMRPDIVRFRPIEVTASSNEINVLAKRSDHKNFTRMKMTIAAGTERLAGMPTAEDLGTAMRSLCGFITPNDFMDTIINSEWAPRLDDLRVASADDEYMEGLFSHILRLQVEKQAERVQRFFDAVSVGPAEVKNRIVTYLNDHRRTPGRALILPYIILGVGVFFVLLILFCSPKQDQDLAGMFCVVISPVFILGWYLMWTAGAVSRFYSEQLKKFGK